MLAARQHHPLAMLDSNAMSGQYVRRFRRLAAHGGSQFLLNMGAGFLCNSPRVIYVFCMVTSTFLKVPFHRQAFPLLAYLQASMV